MEGTDKVEEEIGKGREQRSVWIPENNRKEAHIK